MTEREINEKISLWVGRPCTCETLDDRGSMYWGDCAMHSMGGLPTPYVTSDRCAVDLLSEMTNRNLFVNLRSFPAPLMGDVPAGERYRCDIMTATDSWHGLGPTIAQAICAALTLMIESINDLIERLARSDGWLYSSRKGDRRC